MNEVGLYLTIIITIFFFIFGSISDIRSKSIPNYLFFLLIPVFIIQLLCGEKDMIFGRMVGILIGILFYIISRASKEQMGKGDAYTITALGLVYGGVYLLELLCYSFFLSMTAAIFLLCFKHATKKMMIPFFPFLFMGYLCVIVFRGICL